MIRVRKKHNMKATKEQIEKWRGRDYSWSQHSSFLYNPRGWYEKYLLEIEERPTPELSFGKRFADSCELRKPLAPVTMLSIMEYPFKVKYHDFTLIGYADTVAKDFRKIGEYKTGVKPWDQKRVDQHGQLTFYSLMNFIGNNIRPEDMRFFLEWVPTIRVVRNNGDFSGADYDIEFAVTDQEKPEVFRFDTTRSMQDVLGFGSDIMRTRRMMEEYVSMQV